MKLTEEQQRLLEDLERVGAKPGKELSPWGQGALKALDLRLQEGQGAPSEERERVDALLRRTWP